MGVLPLAFAANTSVVSLGLTGEESYEFLEVEASIRESRNISVIARNGSQETLFETVPQLLTVAERQLIIKMAAF
jgi:aconitate hydratase